MVIDGPDDLTAAVLDELSGASDARFREVMGAVVRHLHALVREVKPTEAEFQHACSVIARLGQATTPSHNEVVLMAGSLGVSSLVCLLDNPGDGATPTTANLLGPFWRPHAPLTPSGGSIVRAPTPGVPVFVTAWIVDREHRPVAGADVDVWHASVDGFYENQDPSQADMNLRGRFVSAGDGSIRFRTVKPAGYPIPVSGPVGELLRAQGRHNMRPAHIHVLIHKDGYKTQCSQVYSSDDPHLATDVQFAVTAGVVGRYARHDGPAPDADVDGPWYSLEHTFVIEPGVATWPRAPISGRSDVRVDPVRLPPPGGR